jgi:putative transposase
MKTYKSHRLPPDVISYAVWLYYRFNLSHREIEDLLAERGTIAIRESIHLWCIKIGDIHSKIETKALRIRRYIIHRRNFVKIRGKGHHQWRAVGQDGEVSDVFISPLSWARSKAVLQSPPQITRR